MGNTVLTFLRKAKHPNIQHNVKSHGPHKWYSHWSSGKSGMLIRQHSNRELELSLYFKDSQDKYGIHITPEHFSMFHRRCVEFDESVVYQSKPTYVVAELIELQYNDFEAMIFQQSLLGNLGMFGADEAFELYKLRNIYIGDGT